MRGTNLGLDLTGLELANELADRAKLCYNISPLSKIKLLRFTQNAEYLVEDPQNGLRTVLHIRDPRCGKDELEAEIRWMQEILKSSPVKVPLPVPGLNGDMVQTLPLPFTEVACHCMMFSYLGSCALSDCTESERDHRFVKLGEIAALLHQNGIQWNKAGELTRPLSDDELMVGTGLCDSLIIAHAGQECCSLFKRSLQLIRKRLEAFGRSSRRYGLIQGCLSLDNLYFCKNNIAVCSFENCGRGWFLSDCGASLSPIMHEPAAERLTSSWLDGYRNVRNLTSEDRAEVGTFLLLHRLAALQRMLTPSENGVISSGALRKISFKKCITLLKLKG